MSIKLLFTPLCLWAMGYLGIYIWTARIWSLIEGLPSVSTGLGDQRSPIFLIIFLWATTIPTGRPFPRMERPGARRWRAGCLVLAGNAGFEAPRKERFLMFPVKFPTFFVEFGISSQNRMVSQNDLTNAKHGGRHIHWHLQFSFHDSTRFLTNQDAFPVVGFFVCQLVCKLLLATFIYTRWDHGDYGICKKKTTSIVAIQYPLPMQFSDRIKPDSVLNAPW